MNRRSESGGPPPEARNHCPWFITPTAVRQFMALRHIADFDDARDMLLRIGGDTWAAYEADMNKPIKETESGLLVYRAPKRHRQIRLVVSTAKRPEGPGHQVVGVTR